VIVGDLFELWRYKTEKVLDKRQRLLDELCNFDITYVPGNHDSQMLSFIGSDDLPHPFLRRISRSFCRVIGPTKFKFMHGHEVDPFIPDDSSSWGWFLGKADYAFQLKDGVCILSDDYLSDLLLEFGEYALRVWRWVSTKFGMAVKECRGVLPNEEITTLVRGLRTRKMLSRYNADKLEGFYDIAIVGHTHRAGHFDNWYFNSGSWTGHANNFLKIWPDGNVQIFDITADGITVNNTEIANKNNPSFGGILRN
jgi:UDP-2,3-diacylglucosamine pyrophosphatase LpxH